MLLIGVEHLILTHHRVKLVHVVALRYLQQYTIGVGHQIEQMDIARRRYEAAVEIVDVTVQLVI